MFSIMLIKLSPRNEIAPNVQKLLTEYGCIIKTRLGLHEATIDNCSRSGLIILDLLNEDTDKILELESKLNELKGVSAKIVEV
ncbi:hypothetical protein J2Z53_000662 [Clostridium moniliforme]|uniref:Iron-only hydrogenase system regulator n=1 Tax=Clostridium moniliforme TaxID=39489 RepID=A0ABS4EYL2_9CLOT|nr:hypothetical protein [Clostridium moniliforme]MBP1889083.1 hypothetical protein [Clostridium moniliforme]